MLLTSAGVSVKMNLLQSRAHYGAFVYDSQSKEWKNKRQMTAVKESSHRPTIAPAPHIFLIWFSVFSHFIYHVIRMSSHAVWPGAAAKQNYVSNLNLVRMMMVDAGKIEKSGKINSTWLSHCL